MSDREAFIAKIIDDPDSDTPRLVFADWLDEHGEPERAEFIRVQIKIANLKPLVKENAGGLNDLDVTYGLLRERERELLEGSAGVWKNRFVWAGGFDGVIGIACHIPEGVKYIRGFIETITCAWVGWEVYHEQILAQTPLKNVELTTRPDARFAIEGALRAKWPRLKFTLPPPLVTVDFSGARTITLPFGWTIRGAVPTYEVIDEAQRLFQSSTIARSSMPHYLYYGDGPTPSAATAPPEPPADPSPDAENTEP